MALAPYTVTALAESDAQGTAGKNIVSGALITLNDVNGAVASIYDDSAGSNPSTAKTTNTNGQRVIYAESGQYTITVNGTSSTVIIGADKGTTAFLISSTRGYQDGDTVDTTGYTTPGDGGAGQWKATSTTGLTPSQTPADRGSAELVDGSGRLWVFAGAALDVRAVGVTGSGDESAKLQAAYNAGTPVILRSLSSVTIQSNISIPSGAVIVNGSCSILVDYTETGLSEAVLVGDGVDCDKLRVKVTGGNTFRRPVVIGADCSISRINVTSVDQQKNDTAKSDAGVQLSGNNLICQVLRVENFDQSVLAVTSAGHYIGLTLCKSFVRGLLLESVDSSEFPAIRCLVASPNSGPLPGHNGLLIENSTKLSFGTVYIERSGEHAVRIGGDVGDFSGDIVFDSVYANQPGQCGLKISPDGEFECRRVTVGTLTTVDCAFGNAVGTNEDSCRLEFCLDITIGQINAYKNSKSECANDVLYISGAQRIQVGSIHASRPNRSMVYAEDVKGQFRDISVSDFVLNECGGIPIVLLSPAENLEHMRFGTGYMRDTTGDQEVVSITSNDAPSGGVFHPLIFDFDVEVTGWSSPGSVTSSDMINSNTTSSRIYNDIRPRQ